VVAVFQALDDQNVVLNQVGHDDHKVHGKWSLDEKFSIVRAINHSSDWSFDRHWLRCVLAVSRTHPLQVMCCNVKLLEM
jgi:hypothetical protein